MIVDKKVCHSSMENNHNEINYWKILNSSANCNFAYGRTNKPYVQKQSQNVLILSTKHSGESHHDKMIHF